MLVGINFLMAFINLIFVIIDPSNWFNWLGILVGLSAGFYVLYKGY